ncbi:hypothetical protein GCM10010174_05460 [Kutzneria viridogrisea]|uniref:Uncharacterized protein n=2 Tax=Kutzneria TaxID=43356 RepID=W5WA75_9PSEU|nr:hypothetical protein [Kutzneria albida]AHH98043.1 hypothetical protein KALB_4681 [Kutzneria albida DSM 43870]MBA8924298.1 hypothetical protein [Kutzneria viridogrisea]
MKVYAERPTRFALQLASDLFAVALMITAGWLASDLYDEVMRLRAPGDGLVNAGTRIKGTFDSAANSALDVPLIGHSLARALDKGSDAGATLIAAGREQIAGIAELASWLTFGLIALPLLLLLLTWLPLRVRYLRRASAAARLRALGEPGLDLLALRALVNRPIAKPYATEGWRERDREVIAELATLELRRHGLRPRPVPPPSEY